MPGAAYLPWAATCLRCPWRFLLLSLSAGRACPRRRLLPPWSRRPARAPVKACYWSWCVVVGVLSARGNVPPPAQAYPACSWAARYDRRQWPSPPLVSAMYSSAWAHRAHRYPTDATTPNELTLSPRRKRANAKSACRQAGLLMYFLRSKLSGWTYIVAPRPLPFARPHTHSFGCPRSLLYWRPCLRESAKTHQNIRKTAPQIRKWGPHAKIVICGVYLLRSTGWMRFFWFGRAGSSTRRGTT